MSDTAMIVGSGEHRVLALHGWFGSARGWGALPDYLNGDAYTWAFMDLRGYGSRKDVAGEFTMREAAADALALADELGWEQFSLVGHSMTGQAIQHALLAAPDRVRRLVAITPVPAVATLFERLAARGESLRLHTARLLALLDDYGPQELTAAVTRALERDALGAGAIAHILETRRRQRGRKRLLPKGVDRHFARHTQA